MSLSRRQLLVLGCTTAGGLLAGCAASTAPSNGNAAVTPPPGGTIDAGPIDTYSKNGLYPQFAARGFFILRQNGQLSAISSICTHRKCPLAVEGDGLIHCDCHGSIFSATGQVLHGPAARNLPPLPTRIENGHLLVQIPSAPL